jgi:acyl-CoA thioester hydrolase
VSRTILHHRIEWGETDAAGIVLYPNYFRWFDRAAHDLFRSLGFPVEAMLEQGRAVPILESKARFLLPLAYAEEVEIETSVAEVKTRALRLEYQVSRGDELVCEAYEVRAWVVMPGPEHPRVAAEDLPDALRRALSGAR